MAKLRAELTGVRTAMRNRAVIEQAKGVLMVVYAIEDTAAFDLLRESSNRSNIAVRDIATTLVNLFFGPEVTDVPTREAIEKFLADPRPQLDD